MSHVLNEDVQNVKVDNQEDKWISGLGTFDGFTGLHSRDEINRKVRCNFL